MILSHHRSFKKMFKKQPARLKDKFEERVRLFKRDMFDPILNNHPLGGDWFGCRSINITGDIRAVFEVVAEDHIEFIAIGSHSELYS